MRSLVIGILGLTFLVVIGLQEAWSGGFVCVNCSIGTGSCGGINSCNGNHNTIGESSCDAFGNSCNGFFNKIGDDLCDSAPDECNGIKQKI